MRRPTSAPTVLGILIGVLSLVLMTACSGGNGSTANGSRELIYITEVPIGENQFLALGKTGAERAAAALGLTARTFESTDEQSRRSNLQAAVQRRPTAIVLITYVFDDLAVEFAKQHPQQQFILIDSCPNEVPTNLRCGSFKEYESSYLLGVEAGLLTRKQKVGIVAARDTPFFHRWSDSFSAGARSVNPGIADYQLFVGGDNAVGDPARSKELALTTIQSGADQIFGVTGGGNGGVFEAAKQTPGVLAYGVDVNQCPQAPGVIVDNAIKRVDKVILDLVNQITQSTPGGADTEFGLKEDGSTVTSLTNEAGASGCAVLDHPDVLGRVREARDRIIAGDIAVPHGAG